MLLGRNWGRQVSRMAAEVRGGRRNIHWKGTGGQGPGGWKKRAGLGGEGVLGEVRGYPRTLRGKHPISPVPLNPLCLTNDG